MHEINISSKQTKNIKRLTRLEKRTQKNSFSLFLIRKHSLIGNRRASAAFLRLLDNEAPPLLTHQRFPRLKTIARCALKYFKGRLKFV